MLALSIVVLAAIVGLGSLVVGGMSKEYRKSAITTSIVCGFFSVAALIMGAIIVVPNGTTAVMIQFGKVTETNYEPGLHFKSILQNPINMNIQTQKYEEAVTAASKDLQDVKTTIAINYRLDRNKAGEIYRTVGLDYIKVVGHPAIQETVKEVTARYNAEDAILRRAEVKDDISNSLAKRLLVFGIITDAVNITNFEFSKEFTAAIEAKVVAQQNVLQSTNKLEQVKVEAQQAEAAAIGRANAVIAEAEGQAKAIQIVTKAQVEANKSINDTLSNEVLQYIFIDRMGEAVKVWVVPQNQNITIGDIGK